MGILTLKIERERAARVCKRNYPRIIEHDKTYFERLIIMSESST